MENEIVGQTRSQGTPSSAQPSTILSRPVTLVREDGPSTSACTRAPDLLSSERRQSPQRLRYVESASSSSEDDIVPCDSTTAPAGSQKSWRGKHAYSHRYDGSGYLIEQLSEYDDADLVKPWHRKLMLIHPFVIAWVLVTYAAYYGYRVWCNYQYRLIRGGLAEASWIFICVEGVILRTYRSDITRASAN